MIKLLIPILFGIAMIVFFAFSLHFSKYKRRKSGCCGGGAVYAGYTGKTCDEGQDIICICEEKEPESEK